MKICRLSEPMQVAFQKSAGTYHATLDPGKDYVCSSTQLSNLLRDSEVVRSCIFKISDLLPRVVSFNVLARRPGQQRLLLYNGSSGYGDQIMTWPVARALDRLGLEVSILVDPGNQSCWQNFPFVRATYSLPMPYEHFQTFDYHAIFDIVCNADEHPDQEHPTDRMLRRVGLDPRQVSPTDKVVEPQFTPAETRLAMSAFPGKDLAMFQLASAANGPRSISPEGCASVLQHLAQAFPQWHWLALHDEFNQPGHAKAAKELALDNVEAYTSPTLRGLWSLARRAAIIVTPDSMMVHVAGSLGAPCVGLWGPTSPQFRAAYYRRHEPVFPIKACPFSPCYWYGAGFPRYCPPQEGRVTCDVLKAITPSDIVLAVKKVTAAPKVITI